LIPIVYGFIYFQDRNDYTTSLYFRNLSEIESQLNQGLKSLDYLVDFALNENNPQTEKFCDNYKNHFANYSKSLKHIMNPTPELIYGEYWHRHSMLLCYWVLVT